MDFLAGKKTYITGAFMILIGVAQASIGLAIPGFDPANAGQLLFEGIGLLTLRLGIAGS